MKLVDPIGQSLLEVREAEARADMVRFGVRVFGFALFLVVFVLPWVTTWTR